jgi:hypothetical protein
MDGRPARRGRHGDQCKAVASAGVIPGECVPSHADVVRTQGPERRQKGEQHQGDAGQEKEPTVCPDRWSHYASLSLIIQQIILI